MAVNPFLPLRGNITIASLAFGLAVSLSQPTAVQSGTSAYQQPQLARGTRQRLASAPGPETVCPTRQGAFPDRGALALAFEPNRGQAAADTRFVAHGPGCSLFLTRTGAVLLPRKSARPLAILRMHLAGAAVRDPVGQARLPGNTSYFIGSDPKRWRANIPTYAKVRYHAVYPGIDLVYYGTQRQLEYDFVVAPGADPGKIALTFVGATRLAVDAAGSLLVGLKGGAARWHKPVVYQEANGRRRRVDGRFDLKGPVRAGFVVGRYDKRRPLVIDPVLSYSTYLGGSALDSGQAIAVDRYGSAYVAGYTDSTDFPATGPAASGKRDIFVTRINRAGSKVLYSAHLGGSQDDTSTGIKIDRAGNAYITGATNSVDFPTRGGFQSSLTSRVASFVAVLNPDGTDLLYSTLFGGSDAFSTIASGIAIDGVGGAWITGATDSASLATRTALQPTFNGGRAAGFVAKFDITRKADASLVSSTYFAAGRDVRPAGIALDSQGRACICGSTLAVDLPTTGNAFQPAAPPGDTGGSFAFAALFDAAGQHLLYSTYLSSARTDSGGDYATAIATDQWDFIFVVGYTFEKGFPVKASSRAGGGGPAAGFLSTLDPRNAGAASLVYSTCLGGNTGPSYPAPAPGGDSMFTGFDAIASTLDLWSPVIGDTRATGVAMDAAGNPFVAGTTAVVDATSGSNASYVYSFVEKLSRENLGSQAVLYSVLLGDGQRQTGAPAGIAVDPAGSAYLTGASSTNGLPVTSGAFQTVYGGGGDTFVTKVSARRPLLDLNGDGTVDLLFQHQQTANLVEWLLVGPHAATIQYYGAPGKEIKPGPGWLIVGTPDFNGDYRADFIFQNQISGDIVYWHSIHTPRGEYFLNGGAVRPLGLWEAVPNPGPNWKVVGTGDFDADGHPDILFQNSVTGDLYLWYTDLFSRGPAYGQFIDVTVTRSEFIQPSNPGIDWKVAAIADLDQDGRPDILFQNRVSGDLFVWLMDGASMKSGRYLAPFNPGPDWKIAGTADLNEDGQPDLLFQNQRTGMLAYWLMHDTEAFWIGLFDPADTGDPDWKLVGPK